MFSVNQILKNVFQVLLYESFKQTRPELIGSALLGKHDIYRTLTEFHQKIDLKNNPY